MKWTKKTVDCALWFLIWVLFGQQNKQARCNCDGAWQRQSIIIQKKKCTDRTLVTNSTWSPNSILQPANKKENTHKKLTFSQSQSHNTDSLWFNWFSNCCKKRSKAKQHGPSIDRCTVSRVCMFWSHSGDYSEYVRHAISHRIDYNSCNELNEIFSFTSSISNQHVRDGEHESNGQKHAQICTDLNARLFIYHNNIVRNHMKENI